jgi:hypothetical protein
VLHLANISVLRVKGVSYQLKDSLARKTKQDLLVSGTNIKTINGQSILGSGNIKIDAEDRLPKRLSGYTTLPSDADKTTAYLYVDNNGIENKLPLSELKAGSLSMNEATEDDIIALFAISA